MSANAVPLPLSSFSFCKSETFKPHHVTFHCHQILSFQAHEDPMHEFIQDKKKAERQSRSVVFEFIEGLEPMKRSESGFLIQKTIVNRSFVEVGWISI